MSKKICGHCGTANDADNKFCIPCGAPLAEKEAFGNGPEDVYGRSGRPYNGGEEVIYTSVAPRSIAMCIILTFITFGIYGLVWMSRLNNDVNELAQDPIAPGGGMVVFLSIVTLGIYGLFWLYKMGQKCDEIRQINASSGILFLILGIFGLGIVSYALIQDAINKVLE
jgi:hypothetical protein